MVISLPSARRSPKADGQRPRKLLAVACKNGLVEFLNPLNGEALGITKINQFRSLDSSLQDDHVVGLHLLKTKGIDVSSRSVTLLVLKRGTLA